MKGPVLYYIEWKDHCSFANAMWRSASEFNAEYAVCHSIGWKIAETDEAITLVGTKHSDNTTAQGDITILKSCIIKKRRVRI